MFLSNGIRDLAPHCNVSPSVRTAGIPSQIQFRVKQNVSLFSELSKVRGLGLLIEKIAIWSKNLPVEGTEGAYCGIHVSPAIRFEATNCRWKQQNYFRNLEWPFDKQIWCPTYAVRSQTTIRSKTYHTNLRAKRIVVDNLIALFFFERGRGKQN